MLPIPSPLGSSRKCRKVYADVVEYGSVEKRIVDLSSDTELMINKNLLNGTSR